MENIDDWQVRKWIVRTIFSSGLLWGLVNLSVAAPTISVIADQTTPVNTPTAPFYFTIGSSYNPVDMCIDITWVSSNQTVVPHAGIASGFTDPNHHEIREMIVTPANGQSGVSNITVTVKDACGDGSTASSTFKLTVGTPAFVPHPADVNPQDSKISLNEATTFGACWKTSCNPNATIENAVRAGTLWRGTVTGQYLYNSSVACPLCWEVQP